MQVAANDVDDALRQVGQIAQSLVFDLAAFAVGAPQQAGAADQAPVLARRGDDVGGSIASCRAINYRNQTSNVNQFSDYKNNEKNPLKVKIINKNTGLVSLRDYARGWNFSLAR